MKHAARRNRRRLAWHVFVPAFLLTVFLFGAILLPTVIKREGTPVEVMGEQGRCRTLLLLIHDAGALTGAVQLEVDTAAGCIRVSAFPKETEMVYGTALCTLAERYAAENREVASSLAAITGRNYGAVLGFSVEALGKLAVQLGGGIVYTLPEEMGQLPPGEQLLSGLQIADVLRYEGWSEPVIGQARVHAGVIAALLDRHLTAQQDLTAAFNALAAVCDDRVTVAQFTVLKHDLQRLAASNNGTLCTVAVPAGRLVGAEATRYVLTE